jgi:hypothetical protein
VETILEKAMAKAREDHPGSSPKKQAAFANSVAYLCTGYSGGYGGPSIREHAVSWAAMRAGRAANETWGFEEACAFAGPIVFGPLTDLHREVHEAEHCFDDDPADIKEIAQV